MADRTQTVHGARPDPASAGAVQPRMTVSDNGGPPSRCWCGPDDELGRFIAGESRKTRAAYIEQPHLVREHANAEEDTARGGYARRQLFELVQNAADALAAVPGGGRIEIRLTKDCLYCADDGRPIDRDGVTALMFSHLSPKRGTIEIGRFGLGFKSVLGVSDSPEFFSRSGSFRFSRERARQMIGEVLPDAASFPVLRLPEPLDGARERSADDVLDAFMDWATNIVRLPLIAGTREDLVRQMGEFPAQFLLFVEHVHRLALLDAAATTCRTLEIQPVDGDFALADESSTTLWRLFRHKHVLSADALADRRSLDDIDEIPICWAVPLDRLNEPGKFWAYFPTNTASLVAGILNAPWKTNEDRQNLLPGPYNDELIRAAAGMIADSVSELATREKPVRHLDALPRRHEASDTGHVDLLRDSVFSRLSGRKIVPGQDGILRKAQSVLYPPAAVGAGALDRWASFPERPTGWIHHGALTLTRMSVINRLFDPATAGGPGAAPRATVQQWLEALVDDIDVGQECEASRTAIETAALIPAYVRSQQPPGKIVLTAEGTRRQADPKVVFLPEPSRGDKQFFDSHRLVHPELARDSATRAALKELGIRPLSVELVFKTVLDRVIDTKTPSQTRLHQTLWVLSRSLEPDLVLSVVREQKDWQRKPVWPSRLRVRTQSGGWRPLHSVLLPGPIVPGDGSRDSDSTLDVAFHERDLGVLRKLGATDTARGGVDVSSEPWFGDFLQQHRQRFKERKLRRAPRDYHLNFSSTRCSGPLAVLANLSVEGRAAYTEALLSLQATYSRWVMDHDTQSIYPALDCESPSISRIATEGRIRSLTGTVAFSEALGEKPVSEAALQALRVHPNAAQIKQAFSLADPTPEFFGEQHPIPLTDVWPALQAYLRSGRLACQLIRCERIVVSPDDRTHILHASNVYVAPTGSESEELDLVLDALGIHPGVPARREILDYRIRQEVEAKRNTIRSCSTDAERLLAAVGDSPLRRGLPGSLIKVLRSRNDDLTGVHIAEAAIATYHTDVLRQYRWALEHLDPPQRWAGSARAVDFVRSLGFSAEWAGERGSRREPYVEVDGPMSLPPLHDFQRAIADNVRSLLRGEGTDGRQRRGMISMPTGSGKTRVAVQAIVEAMRDDRLTGGVLWVADRDELCEQAVEAWRQVWSSEGSQRLRLRVSRMWAGQPRPLPSRELHVVVASIQTLYSRLAGGSKDYAFLADFGLVVFDEAHRSIARTFTSVMEEIGLTRFQRADEPFLLGLTATPTAATTRRRQPDLSAGTAAGGWMQAPFPVTIRRMLFRSFRTCACSPAPTTKPLRARQSRRTGFRCTSGSGSAKN